MIKAAVKGVVEKGVFKATVLTKAERVAAAALGTTAIAAAKGTAAAGKGENPVRATAVGVANASTSPVPAGSIVDQAAKQAEKKIEEMRKRDRD